MIEENISIQNEYNTYIERETNALKAKYELDEIAVPSFDIVGFIDAQQADALINISIKKMNAEKNIKVLEVSYFEQRDRLVNLLKKIGDNVVILINPNTGGNEEVWQEKGKIRRQIS